MRIIGTLTIGQSPRDDVVPALKAALHRPVEVLERGALDSLDMDAIAALAPDPGEVGLVSRLQDGTEVLLSQRKLMPLMQAGLDGLVAAGAELVVVLCGADWSGLRSDVLLVNPGRLFPAVIGALAAGRKLGIIKPSPGQVEKERSRYAAMGIEAVVTAASPYADSARLELARTAARELVRAGVDLVWMTCIGMDEVMREVVAGETGRPVILARSLLAAIVDQLLTPAAVSAAERR
ncbi:MAG: AroM protein [Chloroflexota bacterium]